ncbi:MAG: hypothetical protein ACOX4D_09040 [Bacteroidales bacterium]|jgi:hypothetical protein
MTQVSEPKKVFVASSEAKGKAKQLRLFSLLLWIIAIAGEIFTIIKLLKTEMLTWLIVALVSILILTIVGSVLWKKANRLDPASEKDKVKFFIQNQLGAIIAVIAFLPLVIFIFTNKDLDKKSKSIAGVIGIIGLLVAGIFGADFDPPSIEKYTEDINSQTQTLKEINLGIDHVYWTPKGNKYHIFETCQHIKNRDISEGTVKQVWEDKGISELCLTCKKKAEKENTSIENGGDFLDLENTEEIPTE